MRDSRRSSYIASEIGRVAYLRSCPYSTHTHNSMHVIIHTYIRINLALPYLQDFYTKHIATALSLWARCALAPLYNCRRETFRGERENVMHKLYVTHETINVTLLCKVLFISYRLNVNSAPRPVIIINNDVKDSNDPYEIH